MFFCGPLAREDFFRGDKVVLRGKWEGWNGIEKLSFHGENNKRGAALTEWKGQKFFRAVHVAHPMIPSILEDAFTASPELLEKNAAWRFRSRKQFWPISLHNHLAFAQRRAKRKRDGSDWVHFSVAFCRDASPADIQKKLAALKSRNKKLACLNYAEAVMEKVPRTMRYLDKVTQPSMLQKLCDKLESI